MSDQGKYKSKGYRTVVLLLLTLIYAFNFIDRQIIGILSPFIQADLGLSNSQLGLLKGFLFALFYTVVGLPIAWLADRYNRTNIVSIAVIVWSGFTALTGMANNFVQIGLARMGVGIGEAGGSPPLPFYYFGYLPQRRTFRRFGDICSWYSFRFRLCLLGRRICAWKPQQQF